MHPVIQKTFHTVVLCLFFGSLPMLPLTLRAEDQAATTAQTPPSKDAMAGQWVLVGEPGNTTEAPSSGGRLKFFAGNAWVMTQADATTGVVIFHHGGTFTLDGDKYAETIEYTNESTKELIRQTFKFTLKVEGDTLTQVGIGNPWTEVWKRVK